MAEKRLDYDGALCKLAEDERRSLLSEAQRLVFLPGQAILRAGEPNQGLYVMMSGVVRVQQQVRVARKVTVGTAAGHAETEGVLEKELARLSEGALFGEMSFLDGLPASATVSAVTKVELALISRQQLGAWSERDPGFAVRFFESLAITLSLRLRAANRRIANS